MRRLLVGGVLDSALASAATFLVGLYATVVLSAHELGVYGLFFSGFLLAQMVPAQLVFTPAEVALVGRRPHRQLATIASTLLVGAPLAFVASLAAASLTILIAGGSGDLAVRAAFGGALVVGIVSPLQDHVRRMFHQVQRSGTAATISAVQLTSVAVLIGLAELADVGPSALPLLILAAANVVSLTVALVFVGRGSSRRLELDAVDLLRSGVRLLGSGIADRASVFAAAAAVSLVAGTAVVGYLEAARILSQPLFVLATGNMSVLRPRLVDAARRVDLAAARRSRTVLASTVGSLGLVYLVVVGVEWGPSPLPGWFPLPYEVTGLAAAMIAASLVSYLTFPFGLELIGARREGTYAVITAATGAVLVVVTLVALLLGAEAFAVPIGMVARSVVAVSLYRAVLGTHYTAAPAPTRERVSVDR